MKLNNKALSQLDTAIARPSYARNQRAQGIVHIGVGGFHRAHQAVYTERLLEAGHQGWEICGVGLRHTDRVMREVLTRQDYLYTLMELDHQKKTAVRIIGAIADFLFAPDDPEAVIQKLASPEVRIVSLTITESGYNTDDNTGEFNDQHPDIIHDWEHPQNPCTVFGYLTEALSRRLAQGIKPFTVMSCDNLPHNGEVARQALVSFAKKRDPELARWITQAVSFPNSMVDRITPMTAPTHSQWLREHYDLDDQWPVVCEPFMQWVLEDNFCNGRPAWEEVGVQFTPDVAPYERMKIRLLNASHSAMAYLGHLAGYQYTHEVMKNPDFVRLIRDFMDIDVTLTLGDIPGIDIEQYKQTLIERFSNEEMGDQLVRLCMDGSSKIPKFLLPTIHHLLQEKRPLERVALIIASWMLYLSKEDITNIQDPAAEKLKNAINQHESLSLSLPMLDDIFGHTLVNSNSFISAFEQALEQLETQGVFTTLKTRAA